MADVNKLLQDIGKLSPADKEKISQACGGSLVKDGASKFSCDRSSQACISTFSGDGNKGEVSFAQWRFEVRGLVRDKIYSEPVIIQTLRRSLRNTAADVLLHMGESVKIDEVIEKMDKVFGNILPSEAVLEQFYSAKQLAAESVAVWACRLEDILSKLKTPLFSKDVTKSMLKTKFYSGLRPGCLKNALRHSFDGGSNYDDLLVAARVAELEEEQENKATARAQQSVVVDTGMAAKLDKVLASLETMQSRLDRLERKEQRPPPSQPPNKQRTRSFTGNCYGCGQTGHIKSFKRAAVCFGGAESRPIFI